MKRRLPTGFIIVLVVGTVVAAWAQVFPVRFDDPEPNSPAVEPGAVGIGDGGVSLHPDIQYSTGSAGLTGPHLVIPGSDPAPGDRCTSANRGEIRLIELTDIPDFSGPTGTYITVDALCHCTRKRRFVDGTPPAVVTYHWYCYSTGLN